VTTRPQRALVGLAKCRVIDDDDDDDDDDDYRILQNHYKTNQMWHILTSECTQRMSKNEIIIRHILACSQILQRQHRSLKE
jgi:hypothetical protein